MNEWNLTEHQLRFWKPRNPSEKVKARLFSGSEHAPKLDETPGSLSARWAWLAPVMGCFFVMLVVSGSRTQEFGGLSGALTTNWFAAVASNQSYAAYIVADFHSGQNALQNSPIEWSSGQRALDDSAPILFQATNTPNRN